MKLIINVDDAGIHPAVGRAVKILAEKGVVTSASLVANGIDVVNGAKLTDVGLGVHLDILRGRPLNHWQSISTIVDENGMFLKTPVSLFRRYAMGNVDHEHVEKEWSAQIEYVIDLGVRPTHLSSHKHIHAWPSLTRMAGDLAKRYNIGWMRKPEECSEISRLDKGGLNAKFLNICGFFDRETEGVMWSDLFWGIADNGASLSTAAFSKYVRRYGAGVAPDAVMELCCHPGMIVAGDPAIESHYNPIEISGCWRNEFESLAESNWGEVINELGMHLTDFGRLVEAR